MEQLVPARLRREHERERGIARDLDRFQRVHLNGDA